jgi:hypothetical protein
MGKRVCTHVISVRAIQRRELEPVVYATGGMDRDWYYDPLLDNTPTGQVGRKFPGH